MVRLKVVDPDGNPSTPFMFQFLDGAIKSRTCERKGTKRLAFQFLDGAIKRFARICFFPVEIRFNSLMVRLKDEKRGRRYKGYVRFQFLDGAIKS